MSVGNLLRSMGCGLRAGLKKNVFENTLVWVLFGLILGKRFISGRNTRIKSS